MTTTRITTSMRYPRTRRPQEANGDPAYRPDGGPDPGGGGGGVVTGPSLPMTVPVSAYDGVSTCRSSGRAALPGTAPDSHRMGSRAIRRLRAELAMSPFLVAGFVGLGL
jgi:hypothetical protein